MVQRFFARFSHRAPQAQEAPAPALPVAWAVWDQQAQELGLTDHQAMKAYAWWVRRTAAVQE